MPHELRKPGVLQGTALAVFLALVHTVNDAITAILGALLPTLQDRFDASPTLIALMVATFWIASSVTQPIFGSLAEDVGLRLVCTLGVVFASLFLSLIGVAPALYLVFVLLVIGGLGSAALHPVGMTIAGGPNVRNRALGVGFFAAGGMIGFALGPVLILYLVSRGGTDATPWLMIPGLLLGIAVYALLPVWEPHGRRPLRALFDWTLIRGPLGLLALGGSFAALAFVSFTSSVPLWLVREHGYDTDAALIGWTLSVFALGAGVGSLLGGALAPRLGRGPTIVGSLLASGLPLAGVLTVEPASPAFFAAAGLAGALLYTSSPVVVVVAQDLAPQAPAAASGMVIGLTAAVAGAVYIGLGRLQEAIGLDAGIAVGFAMVVPAAATGLLVLLRHPAVGRA
jgi:FSR family fosmidomycin resistance protein-like MFS transporter